MTDKKPTTLVPEVAPRNLGGLVVALAKTEDGGSEVVAWVPTSKSWEPANFSASEVLEAREASKEVLIREGILKLTIEEQYAEIEKKIEKEKAILDGVRLADQLEMTKLQLKEKQYLRNKLKLAEKELFEARQKFFKKKKK